MQLSRPPNLPRNIQLSGSLPISECGELWNVIDHLKIKGRQTRHLLDPDDRTLLMNTYRVMYPNRSITLSDVYDICFKLDTLHVGSHRLSCGSNHQSKKCIVMANWCDANGNITTDHDNLTRPGQIRYFFLHNINLNGKKVTHIFCSVNWYSELVDGNLCQGKLSPSVIYRPSDKMPTGPAGFMPVQRIRSICAYSIRNINGFKNCIVASPVNLNIYVETECIL